MLVELFYVVAELKIDHMNTYLDIVQTALKQRQVDFQDIVESKTENLTQDEKRYLGEQFKEDAWFLYDIFPTRMYYSFIVSWYAMMETELIKLCDCITWEKQLSLTHKDLAGSGIRKAKVFLEKVANVKILENHWNELLTIGKVRNIIVHSDGECTEEQISKLNVYLKKHNLLFPKSLDRLSPDEEFCKYLISFAKLFMRTLNDELLALKKAT